MRSKIGITVVIGLWLVSGAVAQSGALDPSFSGDGIATLAVPGGGRPRGIAVQADGKIVVAGYEGQSGPGNRSWVVARYDLNGSLDPGFGTGGIVHLFGSGPVDEARDVALDAAGRIVVVGRAQGATSYDFALARLLGDGSLDPTFGSGGTVLTNIASGRPQNQIDDAAAVAIQPDGRIVVAGKSFKKHSFSFALARYLPDGSLDTDGQTGFGRKKKGKRPGFIIDALTGGDAEVALGGGLVVQSDGRIVIGGRIYTETWTLVRYLPDGSLDESFGTDGRIFGTVPGFEGWRLWGLALQGQDIIASGLASNAATGSDLVALRYHGTGGSLDTTFGGVGVASTGIPVNDAGFQVAVASDSKIVVVGNVDNGSDMDLAAFRFNPDGSPDLGFGTSGLSQLAGTPGAEELGYAIALTPSGDIVTAGWWQVGASDLAYIVTRYLH